MTPIIQIVFAFVKPVIVAFLCGLSIGLSVSVIAFSFGRVLPSPEYEGGASPHNQPEGSVVRPTAALIAKTLSKPVTIASRVRARLRVRARVSRWLAWINYIFIGECYE